MRIIGLLIFILTSCSGEKNFELARKDQEARSLKSSAKIVSVQVVNDQLKISGTGLKHVENIKIKNDSGFNENFDIESISDSIIIANSLKNISILLGGVFDLVLSNAYAAATFEVGFTLQDGSVQASHLSTMGASTGQVLQFDGTDWVPGDLNSLVYSGEWDASSATEPNATPVGGEYYIVTTAGTNIDLLDGQGMRDWDVGDWIVYNSVTTQWDKIVSATGVASFNGRSGSVVPASGDYNIADLGDVDTTGIASGKILKWDGSDWVIADDEMSSGGGSGTGEATNVVLNADNDNNSSGEILFQTQGSTKAVIDNDGKIGVGTGAPENALHISKSSSQAGILLENTDGTAGGSYPSIVAKAYNAGHSALTGARAGGTKAAPTMVAPSLTLQTMVGSAHDGTVFKEVGRISIKSGDSFNATDIDGKIEFQVRNNDVANTAMVIQETGNVGIGTGTPSGKLDIYGDSSGYQLILADTVQPRIDLDTNAGSDIDWNIINEGNVDRFSIRQTGGGPQFSIEGGAPVDSLVVDSTGNIGLGKSDPASILDIEADQDSTVQIQIRNNDETGTLAKSRFVALGAASGLSVEKMNIGYAGTGARRARAGAIIESGTTGLSIASSNPGSGGIEFYTAGIAAADQRMIIDHGGNVGIGESAPSELLDIAGGNIILDTNFYLKTQIGGSVDNLIGYDGNRIRIGNLGNIDGWTIGHTDTNQAGLMEISGGYGAKEFDLQMNGLNVLHIDTAGNVGMGTSAPLGKLSIVESGVPTMPVAQEILGIYVDSARAALGLSSYSDTAQHGPNLITHRARGTGSSPSAILSGDETGRVVFRGYDGTTFQNVARIQSSTTEDWTGTAQGSKLDFFVKDAGSTTENNVMTMIDNKVGIGTSAPTEKLHVAGDLRVQGSVTDCTLGAGSGATMCTSDIRLKDEVKNIENASEKLQQIRGVEFVWNHKSRAEGKKAMGVIAQEIEKVFPLAVAENSDGYKIVDYAVLVAPLIEVTNEQSRDIASLEKRNKKLEDKVNRLEKMLQKLIKDKK